MRMCVVKIDRKCHSLLISACLSFFASDVRVFVNESENGMKNLKSTFVTSFSVVFEVNFSKCLKKIEEIWYKTSSFYFGKTSKLCG